MSRLLYIAILFLLSCKASDSSLDHPLSSDTKRNYLLTIRVLDEGNNYNELLHAIYRIPAKVEEQTVIEVGVLSRERTIRILYTAVADEDWTRFKLELQKCRGIVELTEKSGI